MKQTFEFSAIRDDKTQEILKMRARTVVKKSYPQLH